MVLILKYSINSKYLELNTYNLPNSINQNIFRKAPNAIKNCPIKIIVQKMIAPHRMPNTLSVK